MGKKKNGRGRKKSSSSSSSSSPNKATVVVEQAASPKAVVDSPDNIISPPIVVAVMTTEGTTTEMDRGGNKMVEGGSAPSPTPSPTAAEAEVEGRATDGVGDGAAGGGDDDAIDPPATPPDDTTPTEGTTNATDAAATTADDGADADGVGDENADGRPTTKEGAFPPSSPPPIDRRSASAGGPASSPGTPGRKFAEELSTVVKLKGSPSPNVAGEGVVGEGDFVATPSATAVEGEAREGRRVDGADGTEDAEEDVVGDVKKEMEDDGDEHEDPIVVEMTSSFENLNVDTSSGGSAGGGTSQDGDGLGGGPAAAAAAADSTTAVEGGVLEVDGRDEVGDLLDAAAAASVDPADPDDDGVLDVSAAAASTSVSVSVSMEEHRWAVDELRRDADEELARATDVAVESESRVLELEATLAENEAGHEERLAELGSEIERLEAELRRVGEGQVPEGGASALEARLAELTSTVDGQRREIERLEGELRAHLEAAAVPPPLDRGDPDSDVEDQRVEIQRLRSLLAQQAEEHEGQLASLYEAQIEEIDQIREAAKFERDEEVSRAVADATAAAEEALAAALREDENEREVAVESAVRAAREEMAAGHERRVESLRMGWQGDLAKRVSEAVRAAREESDRVAAEALDDAIRKERGVVEVVHASDLGTVRAKLSDLLAAARSGTSSSSSSTAGPDAAEGGGKKFDDDATVADLLGIVEEVRSELNAAREGGAASSSAAGEPATATREGDAEDLRRRVSELSASNEGYRERVGVLEEEIGALRAAGRGADAAAPADSDAAVVAQLREKIAEHAGERGDLAARLEEVTLENTRLAAERDELKTPKGPVDEEGGVAPRAGDGGRSVQDEVHALQVEELRLAIANGEGEVEAVRAELSGVRATLAAVEAERDGLSSELAAAREASGREGKGSHVDQSAAHRDGGDEATATTAADAAGGNSQPKDAADVTGIVAAKETAGATVGRRAKDGASGSGGVSHSGPNATTRRRAPTSRSSIGAGAKTSRSTTATSRRGAAAGRTAASGFSSSPTASQRTTRGARSHGSREPGSAGGRKSTGGIAQRTTPAGAAARSAVPSSRGGGRRSDHGPVRPKSGGGATANTSRSRKSTFSSHAATPAAAADGSTEAIRVMILHVPVTERHRRMVRTLGAELVEKIEDAATVTHAIAGDDDRSLRRTARLLICLCGTQNILHMNWLRDSYAKRVAQNCGHYRLLSDKAAEENYSFSMRQSLRNAQERREEGGLLHGWSVYFCEGVAGNKAPKATDLQLMVEAAGGTFVTSLPIPSTVDASHVVVITSDPATPSQQDDDGEVAQAANDGAGFFTITWFLECMIHQKLSGVRRGLHTDECAEHE